MAAREDAILRMVLDTQGVLKNLSVLVREWLQASSRMDKAANDIDFQAAKREVESLRALVEKSAAAIIVNLQRIDTEAKKSGGGFGTAEKAVIRLQQTAERELSKIERAAQRIELNKLRKEAKEAETAISKLTKTADSELKKVEKAADRISLKRARDEAKAAETAIKTLERAAATSFRLMEQRAQATGAQLRVGIGGNLTRLSPQIQDLQRRFEAALQAMRTSADRVSFETARRETERLQQAIHRMGLAAAQEFDRVQRHSGQSSKGVSDLSNTILRLRNVLASLGVVVSARSILQIGIDAAQTSIRVQALEAQLRAAGGTQERFADLLGFTHDQAERLGFDYEVIAQATARFEAASRLAGISESERLNIIRSVIEASRVLQLSNQRISNTLLALEQIASKGTVSMEELRRQLGDNIPGAVQILAREMGVTTEQLIKLIETNKVLSSEALPALARGFDAAFGPGLQTALGTTATTIGKIQKSILDLKVSFVEGFEGELKRGLTEINKLLEESEGKFRLYGERVAFLSVLVPLVFKLVRASEQLTDQDKEQIRTLLEMFEAQRRASDGYEDLLRDMVRVEGQSKSLGERILVLAETKTILENRAKRLSAELLEVKAAQAQQSGSSEELSKREKELVTDLQDVRDRLEEAKEEHEELVKSQEKNTRSIKELRAEIAKHTGELDKSTEAVEDRRTAEEKLNDALAEGIELQRKAREEVFGSLDDLEKDTQELIDAVSSLKLNAEEVKEVIAILNQEDPLTDEQIARLKEFGDVTVQQVQKIRDEIQKLLDAYGELGEAPPEMLQRLADQFGVTSSIVERELERQTKAAEKAAQEQAKHYEEVRKSIEAIGDEILKLSEKIEGETGATEVEKLQDKLKELEDQEFEFIGSGEDLEEIREQIALTREELERAKDAQEQVGQAGQDMAEQIDDAIRSIVDKLGPAFGELEFSGQQAIQSILQRLQDLGQLGDVTSDDLAASVRQIISEFELAGLPVDDLRTALSELQTGVFDIQGAFESLREEAGENEDSLEGIRRKTEEIQEEHKKLAEAVTRMKGLWKELADTAEQELPRAATAYDALLTRQERSIELCQMLKQCMSGVL